MDVYVSVRNPPTYATSSFTIYGVKKQFLVPLLRFSEGPYFAVQRFTILIFLVYVVDDGQGLGLMLEEQPTSQRRVRTGDSSRKWQSRRKWRAIGVLLVKRHYVYIMQD